MTEDMIFSFLCSKYTQHADARQRGLGLQYTTAETSDLAREIHRFVERELEVERRLAALEPAAEEP